MIKSNCHTHTTYCDGKNSAEEMTLAAIEKGFVSLGFSGHSPMYYEADWTMTQDNIKDYISDVRGIKEKYAHKIDVLCGIELDSDFSGVDLSDFDYTIASVHQLHGEDKIYSVDLSPEELTECVNTVFGGSWNKMAETYFNNLADFVLSGDFDIVGHFDLITKFNGKTPLFDENDAVYKASAIKALDRILDNKPDILFEVNTGAMYRKGNTKPYPAEFMLKHINKRGGLITITSDSHCCDSLDFAFDEMTDYCKSCGFAEAYYLTSDGRKKYSL